MSFKATHNETGKIEEWTEEQVRAEITNVFQHDMVTTAEYSDEEIETMVGENNLDDMFDGDTFEGLHYTIVRA